MPRHGLTQQENKSIAAFDIKQGKSEGFDSCDRPSNLAQI